MAHKARPTLAALQAANRRADDLALALEAWRARFWESHSGGRLIPSDEDRARHDALIGPMPPPYGG